MTHSYMREYHTPYQEQDHIYQPSKGLQSHHYGPQSDFMKTKEANPLFKSYDPQSDPFIYSQNYAQIIDINVKANNNDFSSRPYDRAYDKTENANGIIRDNPRTIGGSRGSQKSEYNYLASDQNDGKSTQTATRRSPSIKTGEPSQYQQGTDSTRRSIFEEKTGTPYVDPFGYKDVFPNDQSTQPVRLQSQEKNDPWHKSYNQLTSEAGRDERRTSYTSNLYSGPVVDRTKKSPSQQQSNYKYGGQNSYDDEDEFDNYQKFNFLDDHQPTGKSVETFKSYQPQNARPQNNKVFARNDQQPVFNNLLFKPETLKKTEFPDERKRPQRGELSKSVVEVKYELPEWYQKDKDTDLYENMCMIDFVRFTNTKVVHNHSSSPRGSSKSVRSSQILNASQFSPTRNIENPPNTSQKLSTPRSAKKWDKHIPRVILFVNKYYAGDMEDDVDDERSTSPRRDYQPPGHTTPYYLEQHQKAYHKKPQRIQPGQRVQQQPLINEKDQGYFDFDEYRRNSVREVPDKFANADIDEFEEAEGLRQSARPTELRKY